MVTFSRGPKISGWMDARLLGIAYLLMVVAIPCGYAGHLEHLECPNGSLSVEIKLLLSYGRNSYWVCRDGVGKPVHCPKDTIYDIATDSCESLTTDTETLSRTAGNGESLAHPDCPPVDPQEPVLLPHPKYCSKFYICSSGKAHVKECSSGLHFSPRLRVCDYPENAKCSLRDAYAQAPTGICPKQKAGAAALVPHKNDCNSYYVCHNGKAILRPCPPTLHFNPKSLVCDYPETAGCTSTKTGSTIVPKPKEVIIPATKAPEDNGKPSPFCPTLDGKHPIFFRHPVNCSVYYMCGNGLAYEFVCPDGLHFNEDLKVCDHPYNAGCLRGKDAIVTATSPATVRCPTGNNLKPSYLPHSTDCNKYYVCFGNKIFEKDCPNGLHFNVDAEVCDYPETARCFAGKKEVPDRITLNA